MNASDVRALEEAALISIQNAKDVSELNAIEIQYLGRKGSLTQLLRGVKDLPSEKRGSIGQAANTARRAIERAVSEARARFVAFVDPIDVTLPGFRPKLGHLHLVNEGIKEIARIFEELGFETTSQPEVESDWFAFEALNMPADEPARDEWETFFMAQPPEGVAKEKYVLTPHATSGTARVIAGRKPPLRILNVQKTYRRQIDASHVPMFHQFDGAYIDTNVTIQHLKGVFEYFVKSFFGPDRTIRFRPYHFRFVEPGFEIDIDCAVCHGAGCKLCKEGWLELGGAGMLHPKVLTMAKINPQRFSGFAFGWGAERCVLMRSSIPDIRALYDNDVRFLEQF